MPSDPAHLYRAPNRLSVEEIEPRRILIVGSCLAEALPTTAVAVWPNIKSDFIPYNNFGQLPAEPQSSLSEYDLQILQIPLRSVWREETLYRLNYKDTASYEAMFAQTVENLRMLFDGIVKYNRDRGLLTFVMNFQVPQQNHLGRLLPRYDLRNPVYFVERLNEALAAEVAKCVNAYLVDFDSIVAGVGRRHFQDDVLWITTHGGGLSDEIAFDEDRLNRPAPASALFDLRPQEVFNSLWAEIRSMYRTVRQTDAVKLVIVDLDDTLWRGVVAEDGSRSTEGWRSGETTGFWRIVEEGGRLWRVVEDGDRLWRIVESGDQRTEGWPLGLVEALQFLKRRGILLAIVSKNDDEKIRAVWESIWCGRIKLDDFVGVKINWEPKSDNIAQVLKETNLLPRNTVFIDDNPVERASVQAAFPDIRVLGDDLYQIRRILLWSSETQVATITGESAARTEMVKAQVAREQTRSTMSRAEFLASLNVAVAEHVITSTADPQFARAFELLNKTNQFNTTGRRWTLEECQAALADGTRLHAFEVSDKFTAYGLVCVTIVHGSAIVQYVMSCRVLGLDVEKRVLSSVYQSIVANGYDEATAAYQKTDANIVCASLYPDHGFTLGDDGLYHLILSRQHAELEQATL